MHRSHSGVAYLAADNSNADKKDQEQAIQESSFEPKYKSEDGDTYLIKRSNSIVKPSFAPGTFLAINSANGYSNGSVIPGPIPESLPTTPGYELEQGGMFNSSKTKLFPIQQQPASPIHTDRKTPRKLAKVDDLGDDNDIVNVNVVSSSTNSLAGGSGGSGGSGRSSFEDYGRNVTPPIMTLFNPPKNIYRLIASCCWSFSGGISDGCVGALLPSIEAYYHISYSVVSLIWLGNCVGFILVASTSHVISKYLKLKTLVFLPPVLQVIQFALVSSGTKFPVIVFAYFIGGIALALGLSQHNYYISRIDKASTYLGFFHGTYGVGAALGPLIGTIMVSHNIKWNLFFLVLVGIAFFNCFSTFFAFRGSDVDFLPFEYHEEPAQKSDREIDRNSSSIQLKDLASSKGKQDLEGDSSKLPSDFSLAVKLIKTWLLSFWVFFYQGAEVGYGSWAVTFFLDSRGGSEDTTGYISTGFWAGVTLSRFIITPLSSKYIGNRRAIIILGCSAILFDILSWVIPNIYAAAIMAAFNGIAIGPMYPLMVGLVTRILPRKVQVITLTIMTAFGSSGGALFPFLIGLMSQFIGTYVLHPLFISLMSAMLLVWLIVPNVERIDKYGPPKNILQHIW